MQELFSTFQINRKIPVPLYYQLETILSDLIRSGKLKPGDCIPTEAELGDFFQLSRTTVRQAIMALVAEGKLYRLKGNGTYVSKPKIVQDFMRKLEPFSDQIERLGLTPSTKVLELSVVDPPADAVEIFNSTEKVICLKRLRFADKDPIVIVTTYLPMFCYFIMKNDMEKTGLYESLELNKNTRVRTATRQIEASIAGKYESELLEIAVGAPIQMTTTVGRNISGEPIELSIAKYRGDKNKFIIELAI